MFTVAWNLDRTFDNLDFRIVIVFHLKNGYNCKNLLNCRRAQYNNIFEIIEINFLKMFAEEI